MNILEGLDVYHFKDYFVLHDSGSNPFLYKIRESRYEQNNMRYQILKQMNVQYLEFFILVSHFELCISRLLYIVQKCFRTPDRAIDPTFQMKYIPSRFVFNLMEILIMKQIPLFLRHPVFSLKICAIFN